MRIILFSIAVAIGGAASSAAIAQDAQARNLAATCANCHGTGGRSVTTEVSALAGLPKDVIVQRMKEFKEGKRPATVMQQLAKGYTDAQIELIAAYFAAQKK